VITPVDETEPTPGSVPLDQRVCASKPSRFFHDESWPT
jgi:hypothetical protein